MRRGSGQRVKEAVDILKREESPLLDAHTTVKRPWGELYYPVGHGSREGQEIGGRAGETHLASKSTDNRQEHWVCVDGVARVTLNGQEIVLTRTKEAHNQAEDVHRLECMGDEAVTIIETQIGTYFGRMTSYPLGRLQQVLAGRTTMYPSLFGHHRLLHQPHHHPAHHPPGSQEEVVRQAG
jgi:mannose-6-phosphate isomerase-like protein (cupin superfamily)